MSRALGRFCHYFNDPLLVLVGKRMELTPRAEVLKETVRDVLVRVDTTIAAHPSLDPATSDHEFRMLASDYTPATLSPHLLDLVACGIRVTCDFGFYRKSSSLSA